ncbi:MAG: thymidine kinase [Clostridiales bacterium]|jgi:thymidine kinase|nr:thymidine kinase [Clostridiales bacterium]
MPKLYFRYGTMGSSKTAQALMTKYNYEEKGFRVALLKPESDTRWGKHVVRSRNGLQAPCKSVKLEEDLFLWFCNHRGYQVVILDEAQFLQEEQVDQLKKVAMDYAPVLCYGLKTDFKTRMFPGSKRLLEIADSVSEIKSVCKCGRKAEVNARVDNGVILKEGDQIEIGGDERYVSLCYQCYVQGRI